MSSESESQKIKLSFIDSYCDAPLKHFLDQYFDIEHVENYLDADYLIYGDFGFDHASFNGVKIFITGENHPPNLRACDYALTHERTETERCFRLPYWMQIILMDDFLKKEITRPREQLTKENLEQSPRKFCNFVYKNAVCKKRNHFFHELSKYKKVDSAGPLFNNVGEMAGNRTDPYQKIKFQSEYKFTIAFENESRPGYQTEKIMHALLAHTVPIYWGNHYAAEDFNPKAFIHFDNFRNERELIDYVIKVDQDDDLLLEYLNQPILQNPSIIQEREEALKQWFANIFSSKKQQRSKKDKIMFWVSQCYGHAFFYQLRRFFRALSKKKS